jgi:Xaa-Pro aminopeptidase
MDFKARQKRLEKALTEKRFDALLIGHPPNLRYLCGFTGSTGALLMGDGAGVFFTDGRYTQQAHEQVQGARIVIGRKSPILAAGDWIARRARIGAPKRIIGIEGETMTVATRRRLAALFPKHIRLREAPPLVEQARTIKDTEEIAAIRAAVALGAGLFDRALDAMAPGVRETEVAAEIEYAARRAGADAMSFETIIAAGARSALPHGRASDAPIVPGGFVVCDFGVILHGYCSDRTRTVYIGSATAEARRVYAAVLEAQLAAIASVRPGVRLAEIDRSARKALQKSGLAKHFTHSTGHGVGLEIHEAPRVAKGQQELVRPGMVITIEPGVYLPGQWGVRIEDMVVVTETGCDVLTPTQKDFTII